MPDEDQAEIVPAPVEKAASLALPPNYKPILVPDAPALSQALQLARSLRPLARQIEVGMPKILDEEATVDSIAETGVWQPVLKPDSELWLDVALIFDTSPSMCLWQRLGVDLHRLLSRYGEFRDVRVWQLHPTANGSIHLTSRNKTVHKPSELLTGDRRRLVVIISDCVSLAWHDGKMRDLIATWSAKLPTVVFQVFPERLWSRTALARSVTVEFKGNQPGQPSDRLQPFPRSYWDQDRLKESLKRACVRLPVVALEQDEIASWAKVLVGDRQSRTLGIVWDAPPRQQSVAQSTSSLKDRIDAFLLTASPTAQQLAGLLASAPVVTLPIVRLIKRSMLPHASAVHIAEVFMSGLLEVSGPYTPTFENAERISYQLVDDEVRDRLRAGSLVVDAVTVLDQVSRYVAQGLGKSVAEFRALLRTPASGETSQETEFLSAFATVTAKILRGLGAEFEAFASQMQPPDEAEEERLIEFFNAALDAQFGYFRHQILDTFIQLEHQFEVDFSGFRVDEIEMSRPEEITLAEGEEISISILERTMIEISDEQASFDLGVKIRFVVELSYFDFEAYYPEAAPRPTYKEKIPNLAVDAVARVALYFIEEDEVEPELLELRVEQPILIDPNLAEVDEPVADFPDLEDFEFTTGQLESDEDISWPPLRTAQFLVSKVLVDWEPEGSFREEVRRGSSNAVVLAIHGGNLQPGTTELARAVAGDTHSFYSFISLKDEADQSLFVHSHEFGEPQALEFVRDAEVVLSIHGCRGEEAFLRVGGLDESLRERIQAACHDSGFVLDETEPRGIDPRNICNLGLQRKGVQVEVSRGLRDQIFNPGGTVRDTETFERLVDVLQQGLPDRSTPEAGSIVLEPFEFVVATVERKTGQSSEWEIQRRQAQGQRFIERLGDDLTLELAAIPGGSFVMGSPENEPESSGNAESQHEVTVLPFLMGRYPITQAQWKFVARLPMVERELDLDPSQVKGESHPVEQVSWYDAVEFCQRLAAYSGLTYRLPSEAEWEYACRAGTTTPFHFGETMTADLANFDGTHPYDGGPRGEMRGETTPVGQFGIANQFGLCDMHGNVYEWCADTWHSSYVDAPIDGSAWLGGRNRARRVRRGGSWKNHPKTCRSASRKDALPESTQNHIGFRVACNGSGQLSFP